MKMLLLLKKMMVKTKMKKRKREKRERKKRKKRRRERKHTIFEDNQNKKNDDKGEFLVLFPNTLSQNILHNEIQHLQSFSFFSFFFVHLENKVIHSREDRETFFGGRKRRKKNKEKKKRGQGPYRN